ncbi:MAG: hypothetical protein LBD46_04755 [Endomicrobium sp.]|jgi:hypothetical protein|nr:hypothetical protein [Endomicrobium sp.]
MILQIEVKNEGKVDYASVKRKDGAQGSTLRIKNGGGITIQVMMQNDMGKIPEDNNWDSMPNADGTPWVISNDGFFAIKAMNNFIQLIVPDDTNTENIIALLS